MEKKKIIHIVTKGSPFGGAQKYVFDLVTHLSNEQFESVVLTGAGEELKNKIESRDTNHEIRVIQIPELGRDVRLKSEWKVFLQLVKIIQTEKPDVVHLNSSKIGGLGALAVRFIRFSSIFYRLKTNDYGLKTVYTAHGWAFNEKRSTVFLWIIRFLSWLTIILCDTVIVIDKSDMVQALNMPFTRNKIKMIHNGIEPVDFKNKNEARQFMMEKVGHSIDEDITWIGTIAELHKNKNIFALVQALRWIKEKMIVVVVGDGEERNHLEKQIAEHDLSEKIFLVGKIENASSYLKAFDIFVLPSIKEGLPYTLLEAGLAGLPTLSTYVGGIPEIIRNNVSGILVDPTPEKIATGLEFLITNPDKAKQFGATLKEKIQNDFSLEKMVEETIEVYRR